MSNSDLEFEIQHERERAKRLITGREFDGETEAIAARLDDFEQWVKKLRIELERLKKSMTERNEIYQVEFVGLDLSNRTERILAKDFDDAYKLAMILLMRHKKEIAEDVEIVRLEYEDTLEETEE